MKIEKEDLKNYVGKKIKAKSWNDAFIIPKYVGDRYLIHNSSNLGEDWFHHLNEDWETYEEPKQKVKMWQALVKYEGKYSLSEYFYKDAKDAQGKFNDHFIKLLPHTEIEVEV